MRTLKTKIAKKTVLYYASKNNHYKRFTISEELYNQVMMFKKMKVKNGKYEVRSYTTPTGKLITGNFLFGLTRSILQKISRKFAKSIPGLKSRPKD